MADQEDLEGGALHEEIVRLEEHGGRTVSIRSAGTSVPPEHLVFVCYDNNNNEVRFLPPEEPRQVTRKRVR